MFVPSIFLGCALVAFGSTKLVQAGKTKDSHAGKDRFAAARQTVTMHFGHSTLAPGMMLVGVGFAAHAQLIAAMYWPLVLMVIIMGALSSNLTLRFLKLVLQINQKSASETQISYLAQYPLARSATLLVSLTPPFAVVISLAILTAYH
jgi:hypothetical protein